MSHLLEMVPDLWNVLLRCSVSANMNEDEYVGRLLSMVNRELNGIMRCHTWDVQMVESTTRMPIPLKGGRWYAWIGAYRKTLLSHGELRVLGDHGVVVLDGRVFDEDGGRSLDGRVFDEVGGRSLDPTFVAHMYFCLGAITTGHVALVKHAANPACWNWSDHGALLSAAVATGLVEILELVPQECLLNRRVMALAAQHGRFATAQWIHAHLATCGLGSHSDRGLDIHSDWGLAIDTIWGLGSHSNRALDSCAVRGDLPFFHWLVTTLGYEATRKHAARAAEAGHVNILDYLETLRIDHRWPMMMDCQECPPLPVLEWCDKHHLLQEPEARTMLTILAMRSNHRSKLTQWAFERGYLDTTCPLSLALSPGTTVAELQQLEAYGCPLPMDMGMEWDEMSQACSTESVLWLLDKCPPATDSRCYFLAHAVLYEREELVKTMRGWGWPWPDPYPYKILLFGGEFLDYLRKEKCPMVSPL